MHRFKIVWNEKSKDEKPKETVIRIPKEGTNIKHLKFNGGLQIRGEK